MGQILVRNLEDGVIERLKTRALKADKSLEQTVRDILTEAAKPGPKMNCGQRLIAYAKRRDASALGATDIIRQDRG